MGGMLTYSWEVETWALLETSRTVCRAEQRLKQAQSSINERVADCDHVLHSILQIRLDTTIAVISGTSYCGQGHIRSL
jgi:hypothetical protein